MLATYDTKRNNPQITPLVKVSFKNTHQLFVSLQAVSAQQLTLTYYNSNQKQMQTILIQLKTIKLDSGQLISYLWDIVNLRKDMVDQSQKILIDDQIFKFIQQNFQVKQQPTIKNQQSNKKDEKLIREYNQHFLYYLIQKFKQFENLQTEEKLKRVNEIKKQTIIVSLQVKERSDGNLVFMRKLTQIQSQTQDREYGDQLVANFNQFSLQVWNQINDMLIKFLLGYYLDFRKQYKFYPPKLRTKYIEYYKKSKSFSINPQYLILWTAGMIQQPLSLEQVCVSAKTSKQFSDPLFYYRKRLKKQDNQKLNKLLDKVFGKQFFHKWSMVNGKAQSMAGAKSESEMISEKLYQIQKQSLQKGWKDLDQFFAVYNYLMSIYQFYNTVPFKIENWRQITDQKKSHSHTGQNIIKTYSDQKMQFIIQCYKKKQMFWRILLVSLCQNQQNKQIKQNIFKEHLYKKRFLNFSYLRYNLLPRSNLQLRQQYSKKYDKPIKQRCTIYLILTKNISYPQSALLLASHNAIRYIIIYFITLMFEVDLTNFSGIQYQEDAKELLKYIQNRIQIKQVVSKMMKFRQKSYEKLKYYQSSPFQMAQNYKIITTKARGTMNYLEDLHKKWKTLQYAQRLKERQNIEQAIQYFLLENIFHRRTFKFKQLQIQYQHRNNAQLQKEFQIKRFFFQAILLNYSFLEIFNITTIVKVQQEYKPSDKKLKLSLLKIMDRRVFNKKIIDFEELSKVNINQLTKLIPAIGYFCEDPILNNLKTHRISGQMIDKIYFGQKNIIQIKQTIMNYSSLRERQTWKKITDQLQKTKNQTFLRKLKKSEQQEQNLRINYSQMLFELYTEVAKNQKNNQGQQKQQQQFRQEQEQNRWQKNQEEENLLIPINRMNQLNYQGLQYQQQQQHNDYQEKNEATIIRIMSASFNQEFYKICESIQQLVKNMIWSDSTLFIIVHNVYRYMGLSFATFFPRICQKLLKYMIFEISKRLKLNVSEEQIQSRDLNKKLTRIKLYQDKAATKLADIRASNDPRDQVNKNILRKELNTVRKVNNFQNELSNHTQNNNLNEFLKLNAMQLIKLVSKHLYRKQAFKNKEAQINYSLNKQIQRQRQRMFSQEQKSNFRKAEIRKYFIQMFKVNYLIIEIILKVSFFQQRIKRQMKSFLNQQKIILVEKGKFQKQEEKILWKFLIMIEDFTQKVLKKEKQLRNLQRREKNEKYAQLYKFVIQKLEILQKEYTKIKNNQSKVFMVGMALSQLSEVISYIQLLQQSEDQNSSIFGFKLYSRTKILMDKGMRQNYLAMREWPKNNYQLNLIQNEGNQVRSRIVRMRME